MANAGRTVVGTAALTVMLGTCGTAAARQPATTIVLSVSNRCSVPTGVLEAARHTVSAIYEAIGVPVTWVTAGSSTDVFQAFRVVLVTPGSEHAVLSAIQIAEPARSTVVGMAPTATRTAYVFCGRVARRAATSRTRVSDALGRAIAHEVGHLLLPGAGHSETGIMRESLDLGSIETPQFTVGQGESIRLVLNGTR